MKDKWINCREYAPIENKLVLVYSPDEPMDKYGIAFLSDGEWLDNNDYPYSPTHWIYLPAPPK